MSEASPHGAITADRLCGDLALPELVRHFRHVPNQQVVFGPGAIRHLGKVCSRLEGTRILVVTDPGIARTGHPLGAADSILEAGGSPFIFDEVHENPTTVDVARCRDFAERHAIDLIVGLGGGSSMDTAKGCNFLLTNGGEMRDYWGVDKAQRPMRPFVAIPTTSGTGSECQSFALIADAETHAKMACGDKKAAATVALLDPELTVTQPEKVTTHTGIDAIAHALETAVCRKRNDISLAYSESAWKLLNSSFEKVLEEPDNLLARARMQLGAAYAGAAIENSMLGVAHSCANPLTAHFGVVHGQAVGVMLPHVIRFNRTDSAAAATYDQLWSGDLSERIDALLERGTMKRRLRDLGVSADSLDTLAEEAAGQWTAQFNPVSVTADDLKRLYQSAF